MKETVRQKALELGFDACRFTAATPPASQAHFDVWLASGAHGTMGYLERNAPKRTDPSLVLSGASSFIVLAVAYPSDEPTSPPSPHSGRIARYARGKDYHDVLAEKLASLATFLDELGRPADRSLHYVDTGPILERDVAQRAGIGFIGKHTNAISRKLGNWILLAEIITQIVFEPDAPEPNHCGKCSRCITACPTQAITAPFTLDARRCISYLTIELKGSIPLEFRSAIGDRIFGCDDCLAACPWNRFAGEARLMRESMVQELGHPDLLELLALNESEFKSRFAGTPMLRAKRRGFLRNVCVALGNTGGSESLPALRRAASDPEPLIAEHAVWAIAEIEKREGLPRVS